MQKVVIPTGDNLTGTATYETLDVPNKQYAKQDVVLEFWMEIVIWPVSGVVQQLLLGCEEWDRDLGVATCWTGVQGTIIGRSGTQAKLYVS